MSTYYNSSYATPDYWKLLRNSYKPVYEIGADGPSNKVVGQAPTATTYAAAAGIGMQLGQSAGKAIGGYIEAKAAASSLRAQASITEDNARVAQFGVEQAFRAGEAQLAQIGYKQSEVKAKQRVAYAANGIAIGVGSSAEVMASTDIQAEADKANARINALQQAWGYRRQRMMSFAQAEGNRIMAKATARAGRVNMYAGLAATAMSAWAGYAGGGK